MLNETTKTMSRRHRWLALCLLLLASSTTALCDATQRQTREIDCLPCLLAQQKIEDPDGQALASFYRALDRTLQGSNEAETPAITRILHYGDSHVAADWLTGVVLESRGWQSNPMWISRGEQLFGFGGASFTANTPNASASLSTTSTAELARRVAGFDIY